MSEENLENKERNDIAEIFDTTDDAIPLENIIAELMESGYSKPEKAVLGAIRDNILYIDDIENVDGSITVYIALTGSDGTSPTVAQFNQGAMNATTTKTETSEESEETDEKEEADKPKAKRGSKTKSK